MPERERSADGNRIRRITVAVAVAISLGVSACGGSAASEVGSAASEVGAALSSASSAVEGAISTTAFIARADAVCKAANAALVPLNKVNGSTSATEAQQLLQNASGVFSVAVKQLGGLAAPPRLRAAWRAYVSDTKREQAVISEMANAIGAGDTAAVRREAKRSERLGKRARAALAGKGFSHCGTGH